MNKAEELLLSMSEETDTPNLTPNEHTAELGIAVLGEMELGAESLVEEAHIVIGKDRSVTVPEELQKIAVQYDHDIETVRFDCPRFWDGHDMASDNFVAYINYMRSDGYVGSKMAVNKKASSVDGQLMHFDWTISGNVTKVHGYIKFLVCLKKVDSNGKEVNHWNSELNESMYVVEGLEGANDGVERHPDIITDLLVRMAKAESVLDMTWVNATSEQLNEVYSWYMGVDSGDEVPAAKHAISADRATCDSDGNQFDEHYVTNEVFGPQITKIDDVFEWYKNVEENDSPVPHASEADRADQAARDRLGNLIDETYAKNDTVIEDAYLYVLDPYDNDYGYDFIVYGEYSGVDHAKNGDKLYIEGVDGYGVVHTDFENDAKEELDDYLQGYPFIGVDVDDSNQAFRNVLEAWMMDGGDRLANIKFVRGGSVTFANEAKYAKKLATSEWTQVAFDMSKGTASIPEYGTYEIAVCSSHDMGIRASFGIHTIDSGEVRLPAVKLGWSVKSGYNYMDKETDFRIVVTDKTAILYVYKTEYYYEVQNGVISSGHGRVQATIDLATSAITNNTYYLLYRKISD